MSTDNNQSLITPECTPGPNRSVKLSVQDVGKKFHLKKDVSITAVEKVTFDVHENELCVLLGPSGCGKSTVLRMVAGLEEPNSGKIYLDDRPTKKERRTMGHVCS